MCKRETVHTFYNSSHLHHTKYKQKYEYFSQAWLLSLSISQYLTDKLSNKDNFQIKKLEFIHIIKKQLEYEFKLQPKAVPQYLLWPMCCTNQRELYLIT